MLPIFQNPYQMPGKVLVYYQNKVLIKSDFCVQGAKLVIKNQKEQTLLKQPTESFPVLASQRLYVANLNNLYEVRGNELLFINSLNTEQPLQLANFDGKLLVRDHQHFYQLHESRFVRAKLVCDGALIRGDFVQPISYDNGQKIHTLALVTANRRRLLFRLNSQKNDSIDCDLLYSGQMQPLIHQTGLAVFLLDQDALVLEMTEPQLSPKIVTNFRPGVDSLVDTKFGKELLLHEMTRLSPNFHKNRVQQTPKALQFAPSQFKIPFENFFEDANLKRNLITRTGKIFSFVSYCA